MRHDLTRLLGGRSALIAGLLAIGWLLVFVACLWWLLPPTPRASWQDGPRVPRTIEVSEDGRTLLIDSGESFRLRDLASGQNVATLEWTAIQLATGVDDSIYRENSGSLCLSPDGQKVAYSDLRACIRLWNPAVSAKPFVLAEEPLWGFKPDSQGVITAPPGSTLKFWAVNTATAIQHPVPPNAAGRIKVFGGLGNGHQLAYQECPEADYQQLILWELGCVHDLAAAGRGMIGLLAGAEPPLVQSPDRRLLSARCGNETVIWETETGTELARLSGPSAHRPVQFSADGQRLITAGAGVKEIEVKQSEHSYAVWDVRAMPPARLAEVTHLTVDYISPDGNWLLATQEDKDSLYSWNLRTGERSARFPNFTDDVNGTHTIGCYFAPDGRWFVNMGIETEATFSDQLYAWLGRPTPLHDNTLSIWETATGRELLRLRGHMFYCYFPDGTALVARTPDGCIEVWDLPRRRPWWIEYGLPVLFGILVMLACWLVWRFRQGSGESAPC
jgi:WD40 repeat protein